MIESLLIAVPGAVAAGMLTQAALRRSPRAGMRWLLRADVMFRRPPRWRSR